MSHGTPHNECVSAFMKVYQIRTDEKSNYNRDDFSESAWMRSSKILDAVQKGEKAKEDLFWFVQLFCKEIGVL